MTSELAMLFTTLNVMHSRVVTSFRRCSGKCTQQLHCYLLLQEYLSGNQITNQIAIQHKPLKTPSAASVPPPAVQLRVTFSAMLYSTSSIFMHVGSQSCPKRMTTTRSSSDRMAWSTCQPLCRCGSMYDILTGRRPACGTTATARELRGLRPPLPQHPRGPPSPPPAPSPRGRPSLGGTRRHRRCLQAGEMTRKASAARRPADKRVLPGRDGGWLLWGCPCCVEVLGPSAWAGCAVWQTHPQPFPPLTRGVEPCWGAWRNPVTWRSPQPSPNFCF